VNTTVAVPLNTMLADLDDALKQLLRDQLERQGFDGVDVAFDAPTKEWSSTLSGPTVDLFLYDIRESTDRRPVDWDTQNGANGRRRDLRPPLRVDCSFAVTAWTRSVLDEHRLLSQVLAVLYAFPELPDSVLVGTLADSATQRFPLRTRVAQERTDDRSDFWSAIGGQYKASLDYVVTLSCEPGVAVERGPDVHVQTVRLRTERGQISESHRMGGVVKRDDGAPAIGAWVAIPALGRMAISDANGRFRFDAVTPGDHSLVARGADGSEAGLELSIPGGPFEVVLGAGKAQAARKKR
jgi:hypothetical protein